MTKKEISTLITNKIEQKKVSRYAVYRGSGLHPDTLKAIIEGETAYTLDALVKTLNYLGLELMVKEKD